MLPGPFGCGQSSPGIRKVAIQLLWPLLSSSRTSGHCEVPLKCHQAECQDELGLVTQPRKDRTERELRFDAARRNRTDRESHTSAALLASYSCVAAQYFRNVTKTSTYSLPSARRGPLQGLGNARSKEKRATKIRKVPTFQE